MRRRFGQTLRIGVAPAGVTLLAVRRWGRAAPETLGELRLENRSHPDALAGALRALLSAAGCSGWPATIVLADDLVRIWQVTPPAASARMADLEGAAALRFQSLYGDSAAGWKVSAAWDADQPFLAAAMPRALLAQLESVCAEHQLAVVEIVPQFIAAFNRWRGDLKAGAWFANVQDRVLTLGALEEGSMRAVRAGAMPEAASLEWLGQHVAREALRLNLQAPARIQVSGHAPASWHGAATAALACTLLGEQLDAKWTEGARLAATGSRG